MESGIHCRHSPVCLPRETRSLFHRGIQPHTIIPAKTGIHPPVILRFNRGIQMFLSLSLY
jgi:hypothetical protein